MALLRSGVFVAWLFTCAALPAQTPSASAQEYQIKAAFLYNFAKFVDWPDQASSPDGPLVIVVFGKDPFGPALEQIVWGKTINDRPLAVRRTTRVEELTPCHILFISSSERKRLTEILQALEGASVLTVSEIEEFLELGGTVRFIREENKIRFGINLESVKRSRLKISSKLLSLARVVRN